MQAEGEAKVVGGEKGGNNIRLHICGAGIWLECNLPTASGSSYLGGGRLCIGPEHIHSWTEPYTM